jgi:hypothetical protein
VTGTVVSVIALHECIAFILLTWSSGAMASTLVLLVPITCSGVGSRTAEDDPVVVPHGGIGGDWIWAKLDGRINEGRVTTGGIDRDWVTSKLGSIAEWAKERRGVGKCSGDGADDVEVGGFD